MATSTLADLKYYCEQENPTGALMLTGEWGCGKTHLIKYDLSEALKDSHIIIRISLFGISSTDAAFAAVKQSWLEACLENKGELGSLIKKISKLKDTIVNTVKTMNATAGALMSLDITKFISISNHIGDKIVVLVFDDLERCRINRVDLLGVINEYCENQSFHTIIVCNKDYMLKRGYGAENHGEDSGDDRDIQYNEIEEKIVSRMLKITPDYDSAVESIIDKYAPEDNAYKQFLKGHIKELQNLFSEGIPMTAAELEAANLDSENWDQILAAHNPHNLRSLRCAIQDFHRVYCLLNSQRITDSLEQWLYSFVMFTMAYKAGIISDSERYGDIFSDAGVSGIYPAFYKDRFMLGFEKAWIFHGEWDERNAIAQIQNYKERHQAATPYDVVRTYSLGYIDDDVLVEGFPKVLDNAYAGKLSLDDYILFIENHASARKYGVALPLCVDWEQVQIGIKKQIDFLEQGTEDVDGHRLTSPGQLEYLSEEEQEVYTLIHEFRRKDRLVYAKNRKEFLDLLKTDPDTAFSQYRNRRFDCFDSEMAAVVAQAFLGCKNAEKTTLINDFQKMWEGNSQDPDLDLQKTLEGLHVLISNLSQAQDNVAETKKIELSHFKRFISIAEELLAKVEDRLKTAEKQKIT